MIRIVARAHNLGFSLWTGVAILLVGLAWRSTSVGIPLIVQPVPVPILVVVGASLLGLPMLYAPFPGLDATLPRARSMRLTMVTLSIGVTLGAGGTVVLANRALADPVPEATRLLVLLGVGIAGVVAIGELAWMLPLGLGLVAIVVDGATLGEPLVTSWLTAVGPLAGGVVLAAGTALYVAIGPRGEP